MVHFEKSIGVLRHIWKISYDVKLVKKYSENYYILSETLTQHTKSCISILQEESNEDRFLSPTSLLNSLSVSQSDIVKSCFYNFVLNHF